MGHNSRLIPMTLRMPRSLYQRLHAYCAARHHTPKSRVIIDAIDEFLRAEMIPLDTSRRKHPKAR